MSDQDQFSAALRRQLAPDPHRDAVSFLEYNVRRIPYSPKAGPFRVSNSPWLREPLKALTDPTVLEIAVQGAVQMSKTWLIEAASCIYPCLAPGPCLILREIDRNAADFLETRLRLLWESVPAVAELIGPDGIPKSGAIQFRGNTAWVLGANNEKNLQSRSIRYILGDEVWMWNPGSIKDALARVTAYKWQSKVVLVSQGGVEGDDWTTFWNGTSQSVWTFCCPDCGTRQPWEWEQIVYPEKAKSANGWDLDAVKEGTTYKCKGCSTHFKDSNKVRAELNKTGEYVNTNPRAPKHRRGYHYNALCAQWGLSWGELAVECIEAKRSFEDRSEDSARREFIQKRLAQTYREQADEINIERYVGGYRMGAAWEEEGGFIRGKPTVFSQITPEQRADPTFIPMRFMGIDVQKRGFYWVIRGWSGDGRSRMHSCGYCFEWQDLVDIYKAAGVHPANVFVDSGDQQDMVLAACAANGWVATRGDQRNDFPWKIRTPAGVKTELRPYSPPVVESIGSRRVKRFFFSNLRLKDTLSTLIRKGKHTKADDAPAEYLAQMQSEKRIITPGGRPIWEPVTQGKANHFWDCEVINLLPAIAWRLTGRAEQMVASDDAAGNDGNPSAGNLTSQGGEG